MSWQHRLPEGVGGIAETSEGFTASVSIPADEDGFFSRGCPGCQRLFKMRADQWDALPDETKVTCPYCGEAPDDVTDFATADQRERLETAMTAVAEQYIHDQFSRLFQGFATRRLRPGESGLELIVRQSPAPPVRSLEHYVEEKVRKSLVCDGCATEYAVYGASAFCPICGPRPALANVVDAIDRQRQALALEDQLPADLREEARIGGLFDKAAEDAIKESATLFEVFAREQFTTRVPDHEKVVKQVGRGVFQRLDNLDDLFMAHAGIKLSAHVPVDAWERLRVVFQQRHVLVHRQGIIDGDYVARVPRYHQKVGQRLVISRAEAETALADVEALIRAINDA